MSGLLRCNGWVRLYVEGEHYYRDPQNPYKFYPFSEALKIENSRQDIKCNTGSINKKDNSHMPSIKKKTTNLVSNVSNNGLLYPVYHFKTIKVTPEYATKLLEQNSHNRHISDIDVKKYAAMMQGGKWFRNGNCIAVGKRGELYNGQHRLWAVIESKCTIEMDFVFGVEEDARPTMNDSRRQSMGDNFVMFHNVSRGAKFAAIIRMFAFLKNGKSPNLMSYYDAVEFYNTHKNSIDWAHNTFISSDAFNNAVIAGAFAYAYHCSNDANKDLIISFAEMVRNGENLTKDSPAYSLRDCIINAGTGSKNRNSTANFETNATRYRFALKVLRAIQAYLSNETLSSSRKLYSTTTGLLYFSKNNPVPPFMNVGDNEYVKRKVNKLTKNG